MHLSFAIVWDRTVSPTCPWYTWGDFFVISPPNKKLDTQVFTVYQGVVWHGFSPCRSHLWLRSKVSRNQLRVSFQKCLLLSNTTYPPIWVKVWVSRTSLPRPHEKLLAARVGREDAETQGKVVDRSAFAQNVPGPGSHCLVFWWARVIHPEARSV